MVCSEGIMMTSLLPTQDICSCFRTNLSWDSAKSYVWLIVCRWVVYCCAIMSTSTGQKAGDNQVRAAIERLRAEEHPITVWKTA
jgi:hypothetical protein